MPEREQWLAVALTLARPFEGCERRGPDGLIRPYLDRLAKPPRWTRGYGRTYGIAEDSPAITKAQAEDELADGLTAYARTILSLSPRLALYPLWLGAACDWAWNCGTGAYRASRLRRAINDGRWADALEHIRTPRTAGGRELRGLARRRDAEAAVAALGTPSY